MYSSPHNSFRPSFIVLHLLPATPFFALLCMQYLTPLIIYLAIVYVPDRVPFFFHPHNRFPYHTH